MRYLQCLLLGGALACARRDELTRTPTSEATGASWRDASPHRAGFIQIAGGRLHYLDWGGPVNKPGQGVVVFLHGAGSNAHAFDEVAPMLTDRYHVVALTERGFGESAANADADRYSLDGAAEDINDFLDSLHIECAMFVAHSMGGWIMSRFAERHPQRVDRLMYLDAAFDVNESDSIVARRPFKRPSTDGVKDDDDMMHWLSTYFFGFWSAALQAEYRARGATAAGAATLTKPFLDELNTHPREFDLVRSPALAVCALATPSSEFPWLTADSARYAGATKFVAEERRPAQKRACDRFASFSPNRRSVSVDGHHYIFVMRRDTVVALIRAYLADR